MDELKDLLTLSELSIAGWNRQLRLQPPLQPVQSPAMAWRFYRIDEMTAGKAAVHRLAMSNVIANMNDPTAALIYLLKSDGDGIHFYLGVGGDATSNIHDTGTQVERAFSSNFLGAKVAPLTRDEIGQLTDLNAMKRFGVVTGVPSLNEEESRLGDEEFQGVERLVNALSGESWRLIIACQPGRPEEVEQILEQIYSLSTQISSHIKYSVQVSQNQSEQHSQSHTLSINKTTGTSDSTTDGEANSRGKSQGASKNHGTSHQGTGTSDGTSVTDSTNHSKTTGTSSSESVSKNDTSGDSTTRGDGKAVTREEINKGYEELLKHLSDTQIPRLRQGNSKGMFRTSVYLAAQNRAVYTRLSASLRSIFQGNHASLTPLRDHEINRSFATLDGLLALSRQGMAEVWPCAEAILSQATNAQGEVQCATWLNGQEIALLMGLPDKELAGIKIRKCVDFALNPPTPDHAQRLALGHVIQHGKTLDFKPLLLDRQELNKHIFITGVTGAGKTTTCMKLLLESGLPFMVIEPAKTEYRELYQKNPDVEYYCPGREDLTPFRLNPFELVSPKEHLAGHIDILKNALTAVFPMEAAMPMIVGEAIIRAYEHKGWDVHGSQNLLIDDPFALNSGAWPNFSDMIRELDAVILSKGMGREFEEKYRGSLVARLTDLTIGTKSRMLNARHSINFDALLDKKVVIELDEIKDESDKSLLMALIVTRLAETIKQRYLRQPDYRHLTLIEEAHRLLAKPEPGDGGSKKLGVEMFSNLLAEVRKYGEGLIIADQIPNKLVADVIKNTNIKIVHRLFSADDREVIGDTMSLNDEQKAFLPSLQAGQAVIYGGGWHGAVLAQIKPNADTTGKPIDEALIAGRGVRQWWPERYRLFPRLAASTHFTTAADFVAFSQQVNRLFRLIALSERISGMAHLMRIVQTLHPLAELNGSEAVPSLTEAIVAWAHDNLDSHPEMLENRMPRRLDGLLAFTGVAESDIDEAALARCVKDIFKK